MHQVFYIDIDEEVTSIIDRLRKSKASEVFFVVPKRSLLMQSTVSLRLLKREAEKDSKIITIVTQDPLGKTKLEKEGISWKMALEEMENSQEVKEEMNPSFKVKKASKSALPSKIRNAQDIGSKDFFDGSPDSGKDIKIQPEQPVPPVVLGKFKIIEESTSPKNPINENLINKELAWGKGMSEEDKKVKTVLDQKGTSMDIKQATQPQSPPPAFNTPSPERKQSAQNYEDYREKVIEDFFDHRDSNVTSIKESDVQNTKIPVGGRTKKYFFIFLLICILLAGAVAAYLFLPKAALTATMKNMNGETTLEVKGDSKSASASYENLAIPVRVIEEEISTTVSHDTTGKKYSADTKKSGGMITIYNEYDEESQQLVATTRFLTEGGKLFRLVKGVVVPGMNTVGGKKQPGAIEAEVIADEPGEEYNVEPATFSIPGFQGSPKYGKFYAKSTKTMTGGTAKGNAVNIVVQADIDDAKKEAADKLAKQLADKVSGNLSSGEIFVDATKEITTTEGAALAKVNDVTDKFDYKTSGKIRAIVFSETALKEMLKQDLEKKQSLKNVNAEQIQVDYLNVTPNFDEKRADLRIHGKISQGTEVNLEELKGKLLGKNEDQIKEILKEYPQIERVDIVFWPKFLTNKIPQYPQRVEIKTVAD